jgi:hypothetical protein
MATSPSKRFARASAVGLILAGATLVGLTPVSAGHAAALTLVGVQVFEAPPPPPPDPIPIIDKPPNPGPNNESPQPHQRRHHGDPVIGR